MHGIKMETILLPNRISAVFSGVSCRRSDTGVENMSGINSFLEYVQRDLSVYMGNIRVLFSVFGDGTFDIGKRYMQSCYKSFGGVPLSDEERRINNAMKAARITMKKTMYQQAGSSMCVI